MLHKSDDSCHNVRVIISSTPSCDIDFYSDEVIKDPFPFYEQLRALGPVVYLPKNDLYALSRYEEVSQVLREPLRYSSAKGVSPQQKVNDILVGSTLNSDPPEHDRTRSVTSAPLLPGALVSIEPKIQQASLNLVSELCQRQSFDAISDFAQYLPLSIVAELVGLPDAGRDNMLKWASAAFNLFGTPNERCDEAFADLVELRDFLLEYGQPDKLKPGGLAKRIFEVGPVHGFSMEKCAQLMRDYIAPSLDTTISTTGQLVKLFADNPDQWDLLRKEPSLINNAVEEAVRLSTPIRAFTRYVTQESEIGGIQIPEATRVLVIYASANRDERKYDKPNHFNIKRDVHDHLGFGQGVHMCMGMHLARLEIVSLLEALLPRVKRFVLEGEPTVAMNNTIRAYSSLPVRVELDENYSEESIDKEAGLAPESAWLDLLVSNRKSTATDIIELTLSSADRSVLPPFEAGAHIDVQIRDGLVRQYSLCGDSNCETEYRLGILRDPNSRGGSVAVHDTFDTGSSIKVAPPRNNFPLQTQSSHSILLAGGIGITPMLSMAYTLKRQSKSFELHYCVKSEDRVAFAQELNQFGDAITIYLDTNSPEERFNIDETLAKPAADNHIYVCGPSGFIDFVTESAQRLNWKPESVHCERFGAEVDTDGAPFTVVAKKSGKTFSVQPGQTIVDVLNEHNIQVPVSCQSGVCGTCLVDVLSGTPDHRDLVQTDFEKASNKKITVCCSRSKTNELVLDI